MELTKAQKAYKEMLDAACVKRDELLARNTGVQTAVAAMQTELAESAARCAATTDIDEALQLGDRCAELERKIKTVLRLKGVDVKAGVKAFVEATEYKAIRLAADDEYDVFMEQLWADRRKAEEEIQKRFNSLDQHPYRRLKDFMENLTQYGGWSVAGWTMEARDEANRKAEEAGKRARKQ